MSDHDLSSPSPQDEQSCVAAIRAMKADVDVILTQLRSGHYASPDTFVNNWGYLIDKVKEMKPILSKPGVTEMLLHTDVMLMADLLAITHAVEIIGNFMDCLARHARQSPKDPGDGDSV
ncbi:hypothetical protein [Pantoea stewartii]|uniref:hypothetical protein n=1 Tax=Pantoea stewartii TaxID=66269 RepID=UPI000B01D02B|nr:hypothetical protein [Pantoea stewartii]